MNAAAKASSNVPAISTLAMGYKLARGATYEEWENHGRMLFEMAHKCPFLIGDWVSVGEAAYGEKYAQALDSTKLRYETLRGYVWVCQQIPVERRVEQLTFSHHHAVAALDAEKQDELLALALAEGWSSKELRKAVRALGAFSGGGAEGVDGEEPGAEPGKADDTVTCPRCGGTGYVARDSVEDVTPPEALANETPEGLADFPNS